MCCVCLSFCAGTVTIHRQRSVTQDLSVRAKSSTRPQSRASREAVGLAPPPRVSPSGPFTPHPFPEAAPYLPAASRKLTHWYVGLCIPVLIVPRRDMSLFVDAVPSFRSGELHPRTGVHACGCARFFVGVVRSGASPSVSGQACRAASISMHRCQVPFCGTTCKSLSYE